MLVNHHYLPPLPVGTTHCPTYRNKRRRLNYLIEVDICSSTAQRRADINHDCDRKTMARKISFPAERAREQNKINFLHHQTGLCTG